ncbi:hypothetical protein ACFCX7_26805 [Streptomyces microflavus]|uniref:hypothetical protein n=1 Tax=Streptomyces microflavus TaxID=1919 RepID=UPI0035E33249
MSDVWARAAEVSRRETSVMVSLLIGLRPVSSRFKSLTGDGGGTFQLSDTSTSCKRQATWGRD